MEPNIKLIVGLGNPGTKYTYTRHNLGFLTLDAFFSSTSAKWREKNNGLFAEATLLHQKRLFLKPLSFMNLSGQVVRAYMQKNYIEINEVLVIHDEADLPEGGLRLKKGGGAGGHNGLRSMIEETGASDFYRLRIGTGKHPTMDLAAFLLSKASPQLLEPLAQKASEALQSVLEIGFVKAQAEINQD